jgi:uncharacterized protein YodC (DUF2158 family)
MYLNMRENMSTGDIVQSKTGGPSMLVLSMNGAIVRYAWYDDRRQCFGEFAVETLQEVSSFSFRETARRYFE